MKFKHFLAVKFPEQDGKSSTIYSKICQDLNLTTSNSFKIIESEVPKLP